MADKTPLKAHFTGLDVSALGEFESGDTVPVTHGGTGSTSASAARTALDVPGLAADNTFTGSNTFNGDLAVAKTITTAGTTGAQTINKLGGSVNFAAAASSLVVTNSFVTANSLVLATVATNDATMLSVQAVPASGSFTLYSNAAATAETRVNWLVVS